MSKTLKNEELFLKNALGENLNFNPFLNVRFYQTCLS